MPKATFPHSINQWDDEWLAMKNKAQTRTRSAVWGKGCFMGHPWKLRLIFYTLWCAKICNKASRDLLRCFWDEIRLHILLASPEPCSCPGKLRSMFGSCCGVVAVTWQEKHIPRQNKPLHWLAGLTTASATIILVSQRTVQQKSCVRFLTDWAKLDWSPTWKIRAVWKNERERNSPHSSHRARVLFAQSCHPLVPLD